MDNKEEVLAKKSIFAGITRNVFFLGVASFLTDVSTEIIYPLLPIFLTSVLGAGTAFVGLVEGVAETTASLLKLFSGWFSDKLNKRKSIVILGYTLSGITRPFIAMSTMPWHILAVRFIDRVGKGVRTSPRDALIADCTDPGCRGKAFGFHRSMDHLGAVVGPLLAFLFLQLFNNNYRAVFWLATIPAVICVFVLIVFVSEKKRVQTETTSPPKLSIKPFDRRFKYFLLLILIFTLGNSSDAFLILRAKNLGVSIILIPILWAVFHVVKSISSTPGGMLSDRLGRRRIILLGWLVYGLVYIGFAFANEAYQAWLLFCAYGIFFGLTEGVEKAFVSDLVPSELRGTAFGMYNFVIGLAALPASLIFGFIWQIFNPKLAFLFGAASSLVAMVLFIVLISDKANSE